LKLIILGLEPWHHLPPLPLQ